MSPALLVTLMALTAYRATRLITDDTITAAPRAWVTDRAHRDGAGRVWRAAGYLVTCAWCVGVWVSAALTATTAAVTSVPAPWLTWGACSAAVGIIAQTLPDPAPPAPQVIVVQAPPSS